MSGAVERLAGGVAPPGFSPSPARMALAVAAVLGAVVSWFAVDSAARLQAAAADPELTRLLQLMAVLKLGMSLAALWLLDWRLRTAARPMLAAGYVACAAMLAAGPVLMWNPASVLAGAVVFHGGLGALMVVAWLDRAANAARLSALLRQRVARRARGA